MELVLLFQSRVDLIEQKLYNEISMKNNGGLICPKTDCLQ